jgi:thioredoxin reductase (NADPH)
MTEMDYDCLVVGGGPAGLTAAIYLTRYHLKLKVLDAGKSRASWIPCTHNHAGYPGGIRARSCSRRCASRRRCTAPRSRPRG